MELTSPLSLAALTFSMAASSKLTGQGVLRRLLATCTSRRWTLASLAVDRGGESEVLGGRGPGDDQTSAGADLALSSRPWRATSAIAEVFTTISSEW
jgi:hypothetical protein